MEKPNEIDENQRETAQSGSSPTQTLPSNARVREHRRARGAWFAKVTKLPLPEFLVEAWQFNERERELQPEWQTQLFWFVWILRGHPEFEGLLRQPVEALNLVERHLKQWTAQCRKERCKLPYDADTPSDPWAVWFGVTRADAQAEFIDVWDKARFRPGEEPLQQAIAAARRLRLQLPDDVRRRRPAGDDHADTSYPFFVAFAGHLQVLVGDQNIKLPCELLAELFSLSKMTISRYRRWAVEDGFLKTMRRHHYRPAGHGDATEFRFDVARWKYLYDKAQEGCAASFASAL